MFLTVTHDLHLNKLYYVRYMASFIIGCKGAQLQANTVYGIVVDYISNNLKLVLYVNEVGINCTILPSKYFGMLCCWKQKFEKKCKKKIFLANSVKTAFLNLPCVKVPLKDLFKKVTLKQYSFKRTMCFQVLRIISL